MLKFTRNTIFDTLSTYTPRRAQNRFICPLSTFQQFPCLSPERRTLPYRRSDTNATVGGSLSLCVEGYYPYAWRVTIPMRGGLLSLCVEDYYPYAWRVTIPMRGGYYPVYKMPNCHFGNYYMQATMRFYPILYIVSLFSFSSYRRGCNRELRKWKFGSLAAYRKQTSE